MTTVRLSSDSQAGDGALMALADAAQVCIPVRSWFLVGGFMVNLHVLASGLDLPLRPTFDVDVATTLRTIRQRELLGRILALGYRPFHYPNRFERDIDGALASIDLVVGSYSTKHQPNVDGDAIVLDGMPGVHEALDRDPVVLDFVATRSDGTELTGKVHLPDLISAIAMKTFAVAERANPHDAMDLGNLLHMARAAGLESAKWPKGKAFAAAKVQLAAQFDKPGHALELATDSDRTKVRLRDIAQLLAQT